MKTHQIIFLFCLAIFPLFLIGQRKKDLQDRRESLKNELQRVNHAIEKNKKKRVSALVLLNQIETKINLRISLIRSLTQSIRFLDQEIQENEKQVKEQEKKLEELKESYSDFIVRSYKNRLEENRLSLLLSSDSFVQAYRRLQYMKQYAAFRKKQANEIITIKNQLQNKIELLESQKKEKLTFIGEQKKEKKKLEKENEEQKILTSKIKDQERKLLKTARAKQESIRRLDREIKKIIQRDIRLAEQRAREEREKRARKAKKGKKKISVSEVLPTTKETRLLSANFKANQRKLPWPVEKGKLVSRFGKQPYPGLPGIYTENSGVEISTTKNAKARSIFRGVVSSIYAVPGGNKAVLIQHGDYYTLYNYLADVFVKKGDQVKTKQFIGTVYTDTSENKTIIELQIWRTTQKLNPSYWIYNMN